MSSIIVYRHRTTLLSVSLGYDISNNIVTSEIREGQDLNTGLIATWDVSFRNDGKDGGLVFRIDDSVSSEIAHTYGYMDIKRVVDGEPYNVLNVPLQVLFKDPITQ